MSLEVSIQNLATAIASLASAIQGQTDSKTLVSIVEESAEPISPEQPTKRGRGRPPKAKPEEPAATTEEFPAEEAVPEPAKPAAKPAAPAVEAVSVDTVRAALIEVVKKHGRDACGDLCRKYGAPNLSALAPDTYGAVYAEAQALLAKDAE